MFSLENASASARPKGYFKSEEWHTKLIEKARYYNTVKGNLKYYDCAKCNNKGVIEYIDDDWNETCKTCSCMKIRACYQAMEHSGMTEDMIERFTFDSFSSMKEYQTRMKQPAMRYADSDLTKWFYIGGQSGAGKTHLCTAIAKSLLMSGHQVKYVLWHDFARKIKSLKYRIEEYDAYIRDIAKSEVLYIDDLFKADKSTDAAFELINLRYIARRPTIISSEMFVSDISKMDEALGSRINEMSKGFCVLINHDESRNFRNNE